MGRRRTNRCGPPCVARAANPWSGTAARWSTRRPPGGPVRPIGTRRTSFLDLLAFGMRVNDSISIVSRQQTGRGGSIRGTLRSRLLINTLVDPDEVTSHLPEGVRPHVTTGGTVVGCCLLDIAAVRPAPVPATLGSRLRAAAHRISVEWDDECGLTEVGVYVPTRHTDSRTAILAGGRRFPGVPSPREDRGGRRWAVLDLARRTDRPHGAVRAGDQRIDGQWSRARCRPSRSAPRASALRSGCRRTTTASWRRRGWRRTTDEHNS